MSFRPFSRRRADKTGQPDVYTYDALPTPFRVQAVHIIKATIGGDLVRGSVQEVIRVYDAIHQKLCLEHGRLRLGHSGWPSDDIFEYLLTEQDVDKVIDVIEISLLCALVFVPKYQSSIKTDLPASAVDSINDRFQQHALGYRFENGRIERIDSEFLHQEVTKPTLALLSNPLFRGANHEYETAHEHYRHRRFKECLNDCLKALESTLKTICTVKKWAHKESDTARRLIEICFENELIPPYLQSHFGGLRASLEAGVPVVRNKDGGHGQGITVKEVPDYLAGYLLHLTASDILLLVKAAALN